MYITNSRIEIFKGISYLSEFSLMLALWSMTETSTHKENPGGKGERRNNGPKTEVITALSMNPRSCTENCALQANLYCSAVLNARLEPKWERIWDCTEKWPSGPWGATGKFGLISTDPHALQLCSPSHPPILNWGESLRHKISCYEQQKHLLVTSPQFSLCLQVSMIQPPSAALQLSSCASRYHVDPQIL